RLLANDFDSLWKDLQGNAAQAYGSIVVLTAAPAQTVRFLNSRLHPVVLPDARRVASLLSRLDGDEFDEREKAMRDLREIADAAAPMLRRSLEARPSLEVQRRIRQLLDELRLAPLGSERLRVGRAVEILERVANQDTTDLLQN